MGAAFTGPLPQCPVASVQQLHYDLAMPTLARLTKSKIVMYAADHPPPHLHVLATDGAEAIGELGGLRVLSGFVRAAVLLEFRSWALENGTTLANKWKELNG